MAKIHKRHHPLAKAKNELSAFVLELEEKHHLSAPELLNVLAEQLSRITSSCVIAEREENDR